MPVRALLIAALVGATYAAAAAGQAARFTDAELERILATSRAVVVYVWSPHMPLSVDGVHQASMAAARLGVAFVAVADPNSDSSYAVRVALEAGLPAGAARPAHSSELASRDAFVHAPSLVLFVNGRPAGLAIRGYREAAAYEAALRPRLAPSPRDYCEIESEGAAVGVVRPAAGEPAIDDVNWFARPVPNPRGHWIIGFASHNANYLYDLTTGSRIRIPDRSDAVATPDGRYMTVPSHYTAANTVNFYDLPALLARLDEGTSAADVRPVFAHADRDVHDVYYQSVGVLSSRRAGGRETIVYRMMFSGSREPAPPGFRIVDYTFVHAPGGVTVHASAAMRLCPQIVNDMATPFISKDGRYVVAHDGTGGTASLKIFEIVDAQPASQTTTCRQVVDFGFVAGKADFSFDNSKLAFHVATRDYLAAFIDGGLRAPVMTDVIVADLTRNAAGDITGHGGLARVTTSRTEGVGSYFPAFFPDGRLFYVFNEVPKTSTAPKRFKFKVVDPDRERRIAAVVSREDGRERAAAIGDLWRSTCAPELAPFEPREAAWYFMSLSKAQCRRLVEERWHGTSPAKSELLETCESRP